MAKEEKSALDAFTSFVDQLTGHDRTLLAVACSRQLEDTSALPGSGSEAASWFARHLANATHAEQRFGKLVCLIAIIDFELSPFALGRFAARAEHMTLSESEWIANQGREMLRDRLPRLKAVSDAWRDVRLHELDEASLWDYRDRMQAQGMEEIRKNFGRHGPQTEGA